MRHVTDSDADEAGEIRSAFRACREHLIYGFVPELKAALGRLVKALAAAEKRP